ncbi:phage tail protein [Pseudomonas lurida]|uniref:phage tail protein n=1 Tax=Pseudomonas lurida TaxID=244566 RepID=UPI002736B444|nr:phage tail protein [Pseudomonas lurida]WLG26011.1 phage tail protein [Pseudomonas lurida]
MIDQNSQFMAILTNVGAAKLANANALGTAWSLTALGVGDANGTDPIPSSTQTKLINERRRAPLNQVRVDPVNDAVIIAEQVIPPDVGGFWIREIGVYDADGDLVAVSNCAPSFKPVLSQGSGRTQIVRMNFIVSSTGNIVLKIDPAVVLATREYVDQAVAEAFNKQDFKNSVLLATTGPITLSGPQIVDGEASPDKARVLVKDQPEAKDNGIYIVSHAGAWMRSQDADVSIEITPGLMVPVEKGVANGDSVFQLTADGPIVLGTSRLIFEKIAGRSGVYAGSYRSVTVDSMGRVIGGSNPTTLAEYQIVDAAPLNSPSLSGTPKTPTPSAGANNEQIANAAFVNTVVQTAIAALVNGAPGALDALNELAAAIGNDPNFAATMTNVLATKAPLASPLLSGKPKAPTPEFDADIDQIANVAYAKGIRSELLGGVSESLNTLAKLANALAQKAPLESLAALLPKRSFAANDFIRIPDVPGGLIIQFGSAVVSPEATYDVTLPISFNNIRGAIAGMGVSGWSNNGNYSAYAGLISQSVIRLTQDVSSTGGAGNQTLYYLAWGN